MTMLGSPSRLARRPLLVLFAGVLAAACAPAPPIATPVTPPAAAVLPGPASEPGSFDGLKRLYEAALAAGEKDLILGVARSGGEKYKPAFEKRFPGITVEVRDAGDNRGAVALSEVRANQRTVDVINGSLLILNPLVQAGELADVDWTTFGAPAAHNSGMGTILIGDLLSGPITIVNTQFVKSEELPDTLEGYLDPKWKGKMAARPFSAFNAFAWWGMKYGEERAIDLARRLKEQNDLLFTESHETLLLTGERPVLPMMNSVTAPRLRAQGAPIEEKLYDGMGVSRTQLGVLKRSPRPNLARLFALWNASPEGRAINEADSFGGNAFLDPNNPTTPLGELITRKHGLDLRSDFFLWESKENFETRAALSNKIRQQVLGQ